MNMPVFPFTTIPGISMLRPKGRLRIPFSGDLPDKIEETHVRVLSRRGSRFSGKDATAPCRIWA